MQTRRIGEFEVSCIGLGCMSLSWAYGPPPGRVHFAFVAKDRTTVDAFHSAALAAGGKDNGPPGIRKDYHPGYYAAFVIDPDGHNVEAVCHEISR